MRARVKRVVINPQVLFHIMQDQTAWKVSKGIPDGAKMRGFTLDPYTQCLHLFVEHHSFDEIDLNSVAPQLETLFKKV
jgi:hypothetical protein